MRKPLITLGAFLLTAPVLLLAGCLPTPDRPALWLLPLAFALLLALAARYVPAKARALSAGQGARRTGAASRFTPPKKRWNTKSASTAIFWKTRRRC